MPELRVYDAEEAAAVLRCRPSWLREQARRRMIPFTMIGRSYRWTDEHLEQIVRLGECPPIPDYPPAPRRAASAADNTGALLLQARPPRRARRVDGGGNAA